MEIEDLCCPICENIYDDQKHIPRLLMKCGHTYCEICLKNQFDNDNNIFICKEDNTVYEKIGCVSEIPKNLCLLNLLKKAKIRSNNCFNSAANIIKNPNFGSNNTNFANNDGNKNNLKFRTFTPIDYSTINFSFMSSSNNANANQHFNNTSPGFFSSDNNINNNNNNTNKDVNSLTSKDSQQWKLQNPSVNEFNLEAANSYNFSENDLNLSINKGNNNYCYVHRRKTEIVCLDDKVKICTSCALFGDHKNHNLKSEEDLSKELFIKSEILIEYFEMIENFDTKINEFKNPEYQITLEKIKAEADDKQKDLKESISLFFEEMRFIIKEREEYILNQISNSFEEHVNKKVSYFNNNLDLMSERISNWKNDVKNLLDKLGNLSDNAENIFEILDYKDLHIINAEKILHDYDLLQEGEANFVSKNLESFKINKNIDLFNINLNNICNFTSPFIETAHNIKENANDFESKFSSDLLNIHSQFDNMNLGHLELPEMNKRIFIKNFSDENKDKNDFSSIAASKGMEANPKTINNNNNKTDKESVVSQQSMINSNSTLNNNIAMLQTDSSFLSAYDENIINNNFKSRSLNTNAGGKFYKKKSTTTTTNIDESFKMGQKSKQNLNSFINESFSKTTKPSVALTTTVTKASHASAASKANQQIDKTTLIKKQLFNSEIAIFNGLPNLGEDGLKIISDIVNSQLNLNINHNLNLNSNLSNNNQISLTPNSLSSSMTLGNINTPVVNQLSQTPSNQGKKNVRFSDKEDTGNLKKNPNTSALNINNKNLIPSNEIEVYKLKEIRLTKCNIGDEGFAILSNCFDKPGSVQVLNLKGNKIKDKSLKNVLHIIKNNKTLKHLVLTQNLFTQAKKENIKINAKLLNPNLKFEI